MFYIRFTSIRYDKDENFKFGDDKTLQYTHLLVERKGGDFEENEQLKRSHDIIETVQCYSGIGIEYRPNFPVKIKTEPCLLLLKRK